MNASKPINIIGFGIAGATLSWQFYKRGILFRVIDKEYGNSSRVSAGMMNPIVFKRLTKSWMADKILPFAANFYGEMQKHFDEEVLIGTKIRRIHASVEEENNWSSLEGDERFKQYLKSAHNVPETIKAEFGNGIVDTPGFLKVDSFLDQSKKFFEEKGIEFHPTEIQYDALEDDQEYIFCEGYQIKYNPYFNYLRVKPLHGDVLTIKAPDLKSEEIINKKIFIQPRGNDIYKVGTTFNWKTKEPVITEEGKAEIIENLKKVVNCDFEIIDQLAGMRPVVPDRRPYLGTHPQRKNFHIFNGLGPKGVMLAPFFANHLADYLLDGEALMKEVDVRRRDKWLELDTGD